MNLITEVGTIEIPETILTHADSIKLENYKTNSPAKFQKHSQYSEDGALVTKQLSELIGVPEEKIDWVYFSVCQGAEPHVDQLDPSVFTDDTFVIPVILPSGESKLIAQDFYSALWHHDEDFTLEHRVAAQLNHVYSFDHTKVHGMTLEDMESGCVVIMAGILQNSREGL